MVRWRPGKLPPVMERTLREDVKWALAVLVGATLGYFTLGGRDASLLVGSVVGVLGVLCVLAVLRRITHRRQP
jgi:hypothetical protein